MQMLLEVKNRTEKMVLDHDVDVPAGGGQDGDRAAAHELAVVGVRADGEHWDLAPHVEAWAQLLCSAAGLPPVPDGVAVMPSRRGQRGSTG